MGFFGARNEPRRDPRASPESTDPESMLENPGLDSDDPRQSLFLLLEDSGLSFVLSSPGTVEDLLREALRVAPAFAKSHELGRGFNVFDADPNTFWVPIEGPGGSALVVTCSSDSDTQFITSNISMPFNTCGPPFDFGLVSKGKTKASLKAVIDGARLAPAWEVEGYSAVAPVGDVPAAVGEQQPPVEQPRDVLVPAGRSASQSVWDYLASPAAGTVTARPHLWPARFGEYSTTERVRESVSGDASQFSTIDRLAKRLRSRRGTGFEHSWRGVGDRLVSPSLVTLSSSRIDTESGRIVAAGHLAHEIWELSPAYDLGAIDGRNFSSFPQEGFDDGLVMPTKSLYVGIVGSGTLMPLDSGANVISVDLYGADGTIACLEHLGSSSGAIAVYDRGVERRLVTVVEGLSGNESIRFSADGQWLLVSRSRDSVLVEVATGRWTTLELPNVGWWPLDGSSLVTVEHSAGSAVPRIFSLERNAFVQSFPALTLDVPVIPDFPYFWSPESSPDGRELLVLTPAGVAPDYQKKNGAGHHLARVDLASGQARLEGSVFFDDYQTLERDVNEARWTGRPPLSTVALHADLASRLMDPVTMHQYLAPARWADEAERILIPSLNRMISLGQAGEEVAHLLPEVLSSLAVIGHSEQVFARQREWLLGVRGATAAMIAGGATSASAAAAWTVYGAAVDAIEAGTPDAIRPLDATWTPSTRGGAPSSAPVVKERVRRNPFEPPPDMLDNHG